MLQVLSITIPIAKCIAIFALLAQSWRVLKRTDEAKKRIPQNNIEIALMRIEWCLYMIMILLL